MNYQWFDIAIGGILHYLEKIRKDESAVLAIDRLCFEKDFFLRNEFKNVFAQSTQTRKSIFISFISTYGIIENEYSKQIVQNSITLKDLFLD